MDDSINQFHHFPNKALTLCTTITDCKFLNPNPLSSSSSCVSTPTSGDEEVEFEPAISAGNANDITSEEWQQAWGTSSQIPAMVKKIIDNVKPLEQEHEMQLDFCGTRGKLQEDARAIWGDKGLSVIALSHSSVSVMHRLRPQPSLDRLCTAGAAIQLLYDLNARQELENKMLAHSAEVLEDSLDLLLNALSSRRQRYGKPVIRAQRWNNNT